jgi:lipid A 4'-phosphatase
MPLALKISLPLALLIVLVPFSEKIDLSVSRFFFVNGSFSNNYLWDIFYHFGIYPAWIAAIIFAFFFFKKRDIALLYLITFGLGAGIISQVFFKTFWPRPRPLQVDIFGGFAPYQPFWIPALKLNETMKSMPCGHCTMGFVFFALILIGFRLKNKLITLLGFFLVIFLGLGLSVARIAKGGHFFSDALIAMIIMWISAVLADAWIKFKYPIESKI